MAEVDRIEADEGGEQAPVGLGQPLADEEALVREPRLEDVERFEQRPERLLVGLLGGREAGAIDAVVDGRVDARVQRVDLAPKLGRVIVAFRRADRVEGAVEHADDLG